MVSRLCMADFGVCTEASRLCRAKRNAAASTAAVKRNHRFKKNNLIPFIFAQKRQKTLCNDKCSRKQQKKQLPFCEFIGLFEADCAVFRCQLRANGL